MEIFIKEKLFFFLKKKLYLKTKIFAGNIFPFPLSVSENVYVPNDRVTNLQTCVKDMDSWSSGVKKMLTIYVSVDRHAVC
jgi:hypothetical protein